MEVKKIGRRRYLFTFDDLLEMGCPTNVYVIIGNSYIFICDTYLGPDYMVEVKEYIYKDKGVRQLPIIVFNSHSDWDHIWGNSAFSSSIIIAHQKCRENIDLEWEKGYQKHHKYAKGLVQKVLPNLTFTGELTFPEEGIKFFYTPGHTRDSASCLDIQEKILFVGDNVEAPHPYFQTADRGLYLSTLNSYLEMDLDWIIPGHGEPCGKDLVIENIEYIKTILR
jgi:glyoxylase-like metal-dependent hydrolase (beta-lactamase superfamily II)